MHARRRIDRPWAASGTFVERDDAGAAETEIVLQAEPRALHLRRRRGAAQLPGQLVALRKPGGAERMALRQQAAGRIGDDPAAIAVVAIVDELGGLALAAQAEPFIGDQLVMREAVVQIGRASCRERV